MDVIRCDIVQDVGPIFARENLIHAQKSIVYVKEWNLDGISTVILLRNLTAENLGGENGGKET